MGADTFILVLYTVSAVVSFGCALLPGSGLLGRLLCLLAGAGLLGWPAAGYLIDGYHPLSPAVAAVPAIMLIYAGLTLQRYLGGRTWLPGVRTPLGGPETAGPPAPAPTVERRSPNRRTLPGEFGSTPVNAAPPSHDPWAALYGSYERELLRGCGNGRHRAYPLAVAPATRPTATPPAGYAGQAAFVAMQAYAAGQASAAMHATRLWQVPPDWCHPAGADDRPEPDGGPADQHP